jgi:hypothetical protein
MMRVALILGISSLLAFAPAPASAQDEGEDTRSRTSKKVSETEVGGSYRASVFGGTYLQGARYAPMVDAGLRGGADFGVHEILARFDYVYDPFSTKSFNFADENQTTDSVAVTDRLVQSMHEVEGKLGWDARWSKMSRTKAWLSGGMRLPEFDSDRRYSADLDLNHRYGKHKKWFVEGDFGLFIRKYPNYFIADRRIDNKGVSLTPGVGYVFEGGHELEAKYGFEFTSYDDARYDVLEPNGSITRSNESKEYVSQNVILDGTYRPSKAIKLRLRYQFELNDSIAYDREIGGVGLTGASEDKFMADYYDYSRHLLRLRGSWDRGKLSLTSMAEYWVRGFDTYEARDADNVWTGELRQDHSIELGLEASYLVAEPAGTLLSVVGFVSHLHRDSNMKREISFATNYDVTRIFAGVEVRSK